MTTKSDKRAHKILIIILVLAFAAIVAIVIWGLNYSKAYHQAGSNEVYLVNDISIPSVDVALDREVTMAGQDIVPISKTKSIGYFTYTMENLSTEDIGTYFDYLTTEQGFGVEQGQDDMSIMVKEFTEQQKTALLYVQTETDKNFVIVIEVTPMLTDSEKSDIMASTSSGADATQSVVENETTITYNASDLAAMASDGQGNTSDTVSEETSSNTSGETSSAE